MSIYRSEDTITSDTTPVRHAISMASPRFLTVKEVASRLSISVSTVWRLSRTDVGFPRARRIAIRSTRWLLSDLEAYEASRRLIH